jgi:hypothetical protein
MTQQQPMNDIARLQATVRVLHRMYEAYRDECNDTGIPAAPMIFTDWLRYMLGYDWTNDDPEYQASFAFDGIVWPQHDKEVQP